MRERLARFHQKVFNYEDYKYNAYNVNEAYYNKLMRMPYHMYCERYGRLCKGSFHNILCIQICSPQDSTYLKQNAGICCPPILDEVVQCYTKVTLG